MKELLLFCLFAISVSNAFAQSNDTKADTLKTKQDIAVQLDLLEHQPHTIVLDSLSQTSPVLDTIAVLSDSLSLLKELLMSKDKEIAAIKQELKTRMAVADDAIVRLSYRRLSEPYSKDKVDKAIKEMSNIYTKEIKDKNSDILELLRSYERYYREIKQIITDAQSDGDRTNIWALPDIFKNRYRCQIEQSFYYRDYYKKKVPTSKYLNELIDRFLSELDEHSDKKQADFSRLLN